MKKLLLPLLLMLAVSANADITIEEGALIERPTPIRMVVIEDHDVRSELTLVADLYQASATEEATPVQEDVVPKCEYAGVLDIEHAAPARMQPFAKVNRGILG